jgi:hypothetical protein
VVVVEAWLAGISFEEFVESELCPWYAPMFGVYRHSSLDSQIPFSLPTPSPKISTALRRKVVTQVDPFSFDPL